MKEDKELRKWNMGWVSRIEWNRICEIENARTVEVYNDSAVVIFQGKGRTTRYHIRKYWIDRLEAITIRLPGMGYNTRIERIYPKPQKVLISKEMSFGLGWAVLLSCGHTISLVGMRNPKGKFIMCPVKDCILSRYPKGKLNEKE